MSKRRYRWFVGIINNNYPGLLKYIYTLKNSEISLISTNNIYKCIALKISISCEFYNTNVKKCNFKFVCVFHTTRISDSILLSNEIVKNYSKMYNANLKEKWRQMCHLATLIEKRNEIPNSVLVKSYETYLFYTM